MIAARYNKPWPRKNMAHCFIKLGPRTSIADSGGIFSMVSVQPKAGVPGLENSNHALELALTQQSNSLLTIMQKPEL